MALNVISNFAANVAHRHLTMSDKAATESVAKLSSGQRVLAAKDDAAAMAIGTRLSAEEKALGQAQINAGQAVSMLQIADGAMSRINDILVRMKTLAVQSSSGQLSDTERSMLDQEFQSLLSEVDRIAEDTEFNGTKLTQGSTTFAATTVGTDLEVADGFELIDFSSDTGAFSAGDTVQVEYDATADQFTLTNQATGESFTSAAGVSSPSAGTFKDVTIAGAGVTIRLNSQFDDTAGITHTGVNQEFVVTGGSSTTLSLDFKVGTGTDSQDNITISVESAQAADLDAALATASIDTSANADSAITAVGNAIDKLAENRAKLGASQNRLEFASENIATTRENTEAARSDLMDLDVAKEMSNFTSKQILVQAGTSMLAQANQLPQNLLSLFR